MKETIMWEGKRLALECGCDSPSQPDAYLGRYTKYKLLFCSDLGLDILPCPKCGYFPWAIKPLQGTGG